MPQQIRAPMLKGCRRPAGGRGVPRCATVSAQVAAEASLRFDVIDRGEPRDATLPTVGDPLLPPIAQTCTGQQSPGWRLASNKSQLAPRGRRGRMVERRNYWSRAALTARIVKWLKSQGGELPPATDPNVAERILKCLAIRGLARKESGTWKATRPLIAFTVLKRVDADI